MRNGLRLHIEVEPREFVLCIPGARQGPDDVEQFLLGQPHQRSPQQRAEGERVAPVGENAGYRDEVLHLLTPEEAFPRLGRDRDAVPFERLLIAPEVGPGGRQQGNIARLAGPHFTALRIANGLAADQLRTHGSHGSGFPVPQLLDLRPVRFVCCRDVQGKDRRASGTRGLKGNEGLEARLAVLLRKRIFEALVHIGHDRRAGTEISGNRKHAVRRLRAERLACPDIGGNIRAAETIDRLFRVAHKKEGARPERKRGPVAGITVRRRLAAKPPEDLRLQGVRILELVHQNVGELPGKSPANLVEVPQQIARGEDQVIEVELRRRALVLAETVHDRSCDLHEVGKHARGGRLLQCGPCLAASGIVGIGIRVQAIAVGLGEARLSGGSSPFRLLLVFAELAGLGAKIGMRRGNQKSDNRSVCLGRQEGADLFGQFPEASRPQNGIGFLDFGIDDECVESGNSLLECGCQRCGGFRRSVGDIAMAPKMLKHCAYQPDRRVRILKDQLRKQSAAVAGQFLPQPGVGDLPEGEVRLVAVHDGRAGIDIGLDRIG